MESFKRNQVEEAIAGAIGESSGRPSSGLRTRLKRLLETDRGLGRNSRSSEAVAKSYAFFSDEAPGRGVEVQFSAYEAFALLVALRLFEHGWPQSFVVGVMRCVRTQLEAQHARILKQDPEKLFDVALIRQKARPGDLVVDNTDPVFLVILSGQEKAKDDRPQCSICRGMEEVSRFVRSERALSWTLFDLVKSAHVLSVELSKTKPRSRGRS